MLLPPDRAFLVRLYADADPVRGPLLGRVEHLTSGKRADFSSAEELEAFIKKILAQEPREEDQRVTPDRARRPEED